jgi:transcriptional regulator with XRE-family HTH domain
MSGHRVNWVYVADALDVVCQARDMSLREVAIEIGISPSGLTRLRQGKHLSADALASLMVWMFPASVPRWIEVNA